MKEQVVKKTRLTRRIIGLLVVMSLLSGSGQLLAGNKEVNTQPTVREDNTHIVVARGQYNQMPSYQHDNEQCE